MSTKLFLAKKLDFLCQLTEMALIAVHFGEMEQVLKCVNRLKEEVDRLEYLENDDPKWYFYYNGILVYEATIPEILISRDANGEDPTVNKSECRENLTRLKKFFTLVKRYVAG